VRIRAFLAFIEQYTEASASAYNKSKMLHFVLTVLRNGTDPDVQRLKVWFDACILIAERFRNSNKSAKKADNTARLTRYEAENQGSWASASVIGELQRFATGYLGAACARLADILRSSPTLLDDFLNGRRAPYSAEVLQDIQACIQTLCICGAGGIRMQTVAKLALEHIRFSTKEKPTGGDYVALQGDGSAQIEQLWQAQKFAWEGIYQKRFEQVRMFVCMFAQCAHLF
jgi:hypothetical protein